MSIFTVEFEEIELTRDGAAFLGNFEVSFTYSTRGYMQRCRVEEVAYYDRSITVRNIDTDEEFEVALPAKDALGEQVELAIWADEDRIYEQARADLDSEYINAMELRRDAARDDARFA